MTGLQHDSAVVQRETFAPIVYVLKFNVSFGSTVIQLTNILPPACMHSRGRTISYWCLHVCIYNKLNFIFSHVLHIFFYKNDNNDKALPGCLGVDLQSVLSPQLPYNVLHSPSVSTVLIRC